MWLLLKFLRHFCDGSLRHSLRLFLINTNGGEALQNMLDEKKEGKKTCKQNEQ